MKELFSGRRGYYYSIQVQDTNTLKIFFKGRLTGGWQLSALVFVE
jgi:hypothetical protein